MRPIPIASGLAIISLLLALFLLLDTAAIRQALGQVSLLAVVSGLVIVQIQIILSALRWRFTAGRLGQKMPASHALGEYYLASALNQVLPGGMAGDALRAYRGRGEGGAGMALSTKAVILERLSGQLAFFSICACGLLFWPSLLARILPGAAPVWLALVVMLLLGASGLILRRLRSLRQDLTRAFVERGAWRVQLLLSLGTTGAYLLLFWLAAYATGGALPVTALVTVIPLCLLSMLIPTGFGGWGTREAAAAALWPLVGLASAQGVAASILYGALALIGSLPGLAVLVFHRRKGHVTAQGDRRA
ncbi:lysylphosphatidylglycerol synthase transmembrane domain-containing protein [Rhizobium sp. SSA_523]|uniref:lysylphosphatidylglycerol synthase transmembrane domain-containing protein n=1 Tax=Rhizobium sp. SSA_523 TaxID=2952477 RepID=UPI00209100EA|nr:lysylphosphatidylglycerol synthase transmembrane domain-containing protein [Rhizobium sp. SSA_523]MCO5732478.1 flippase-like domain-containing protein [Rhizobium sp. SSA_523]WKC22381.1 lysylphosphatidylglycerol synthase transmembrane domain-containing protein [Rhizobium sp. SSA_523]